MSLSLKELKRLHQAGLSLWYLHPRQKRPIGNDWTSLPNKTWEELKSEFSSKNNVGVRLGKWSKLKKGYLACIDVDVHHTKYKRLAYAKLKELIGEKRFPEVVSGSGNGSRHLYCVTKKPFKPITIAKHKDRWEIVIYSTGRQMVLPGSVHPSGTVYSWKGYVSIEDAPRIRVDDFRHNEDAGDSGTDAKQCDDFKAVQVDLWATNLSPGIIQLIEDGAGCSDRSASLLSAAMAMCRVKFTDNQILSVLSDERHYLGKAVYDRRRGRKSAVDWLRKYVLTKARHETSVMRYFDNPPTPEERAPKNKVEVEEAREEIEDELGESLPDLDGKGKPRPTVRNIVHILEHFMSGGLVGFDEFANRLVFLKDTPYGGKKGNEVTDNDDLQLLHYLACHYAFEPSQDFCFKAHQLIGRRFRYHPVRAFLRGLEWDGKKRLDSWLQRGFAACGPADYLGAISRKTLVAAVKRVMEPGCKFDYMMVLEGHQGKGKSMALDALASGKWFTDSLGDIHNKDVVDQMTGKWLIEMAELSSIKGKDIESTKAFISRRVDRCRPPYGRRSQDFPRQSIFIGTTNDTEYLHDETGNRRVWPVTVETINVEWIKKNRKQLWAEALMRYELGEDVFLTPELEKVAKAEQEKRFATDEWEAEIKTIVKKTEGPYLITELWRAINLTNGHPNMYDSKRIASVMRRLRFVRVQRKLNGVNTKVWIKEWKK